MQIIDAKLFKSDNKYDSGTGWPSFTEALPGAFKTKVDYSFGMEKNGISLCKLRRITMDMFLMTGLVKMEKRCCNNGLCLILKPSD